MQKTLIAITFALTLSCAAAVYTATNYAKAPTVVVQDSETNFTNTNGGLGLASLQVGELDLVSANAKAPLDPTTTYDFFYRKLDAKSLTGNANSTFNLSAQPTLIVGGYAIAISPKGVNDSLTQAANIRVAQVPISGGAALPVFNISSNTNANFTPTYLGALPIDKTVYVFNLVADKKVNITSFTAGGSAGKTDFALTSAYESGLQYVWGEALGKNQIYAIWTEGGVLKGSAADVSKGSATIADIGAWGKTYGCSPYATDKKLFGVICSNVTNITDGSTSYFVSTTNSSLVALTNNSASINSTFSAVHPYGPYIAVLYTDKKTTTGSTLHSYEIWNLDNITPVKNRTQYLTIDGASTARNFRVVSGGLYTLLYNNRPEPNPNNTGVTGVQVGLLLGSSYLASVFGFLLTIIAGLFLF